MNTFSIINKKMIFRLLGFLLLLESFFLFISFAVAFFFNEDCKTAFLISFLISFFIGGSTVFFTRNTNKEFGKREGYNLANQANGYDLNAQDNHQARQNERRPVNQWYIKNQPDKNHYSEHSPCIFPHGYSH